MIAGAICYYYWTMKRLLLIISIVFAVSSCFGDGPMTTRSYTMVANFEYTGENYLDIFGPDSLYFGIKEPGFSNADFLFYHNVDTLKEQFNGGFLISYLDIPKSEVTDSLENNAYRVNTVQSPGRNTFIVFHQNDNESLMPKRDSEFRWTKYGTCVMTGCYVNNTVMVADSLRARFEPGDKLILKATGWLNDQKTGEAEVTLADFSAKKDSIVSKWTAFDLSKLGSVKYVDFEIISTQDDFPLYVCIDSITAQVDLEY